MPRKVSAKTPSATSAPVAAKKTARTEDESDLHEQGSLLPESTEEESDADEPKDGKPKIEGRKLINLLKKTLIERGLPDRHIADLMGVTTIYWASMCNGHRKIKAVGKEKLERVAEFLGMPTVQVLVLADYFDPTDFYVKRTLEDELNIVRESMQADPNWVSLVPSFKEWNQISVNSRILIALLYEREAGRNFMRKLQMEHPALATAIGMENKEGETA